MAEGGRPRAGKKTINIALQGGGSHGAFAWGVLDRLLEEPGIAVEGVVGTSAGAMNAAVTAYGLAINFVSRLVDSGFDDEGRLKKMLIHCIDAEEKMRELGASSKLNASWDFLMYLHELGRERGEAFLNAHYDRLGRESSTPIAERFL